VRSASTKSLSPVTTNARFAARWSPIVEAVTSADTPTEQKRRSHGWAAPRPARAAVEPVQRAVLLAGRGAAWSGPKRSVRPAEPKSIEPPVHTLTVGHLRGRHRRHGAACGQAWRGPARRTRHRERSRRRRARLGAGTTRLTGGDEIGHVQLAGERPSAETYRCGCGSRRRRRSGHRCKGCAEEAIDVALGSMATATDPSWTRWCGHRARVWIPRSHRSSAPSVPTTLPGT